MSEHLRQLPDASKHAMDALSVGAVVGALVQWLPSIAALLTVIWTLIRIFETDTVRRGIKSARLIVARLKGPGA